MICAIAISVLFMQVGFAETTNNLVIAHFQPAKTNYFLGEPITIYLNITSKYTNIINIVDPIRAEFKSEEASKGLGVSRVGPVFGGTVIRLLPKGHLQKTYYINKSLNFEKPGKYCVDCMAEVEDYLGIPFKIPPQAQAMMTQDTLTDKKKEPQIGDSNFYRFPAPTSSPPNAILVKVQDRITFTVTKGSVEQLANVYGDLLNKAKTLRDKNPEAQYNEPVLALCSLRNPLVVPYLIKAMTSADPADPISEQSMIRALEEIKTPEAIKGIAGIDVTNRRTAFLRQYAADALGRMKAKEGIPFLIKLLDDDYDQAQIYAIQALGQIGTTECLDAIRQKIKGFKGKVKETAIEVLKKSSPAE